jgi:hypothetical protein
MPNFPSPSDLIKENVRYRVFCKTERKYISKKWHTDENLANQDLANHINESGKSGHVLEVHIEQRVVSRLTA